jgi:hypothetical protein
VFLHCFGCYWNGDIVDRKCFEDKLRPDRKSIILAID